MKYRPRWRRLAKCLIHWVGNLIIIAGAIVIVTTEMDPWWAVLGIGSILFGDFLRRFVGEKSIFDRPKESR
jgi:hypothetical protein